MPLLELLNYSVSVPLQTTSTETIFKGEKKTEEWVSQGTIEKI